MSGILGALSYAGDSLDKLGSRALRGTLGGHPRELASVIPFSDRLGITDPNDIVSGRNLTDKAGITKRGDTGWGAWGAGAAAEALLDPTNLAGVGLLARRAMGGVGSLKGSGHLLERLGRGTDDVFKRMEPFGSQPGMLNMMSVPPGGGSWSKRAADLADAYGPRHPTTPEQLLQMLGHGTDNFPRPAYGLAGDPELHRIAQEFHPDSKFLGNGVESVALRNQGNHIVKITHIGDDPALANGVANIPEMLQPVRSNIIGRHVVAHYPAVNPLRDGYPSNLLTVAENALGHGAGGPELRLAAREAMAARRGILDSSDNVARRLSDTIDQDVYDPWDVKGHNAALTREGNAIIHDGGSVALQYGGNIPLHDQLMYPSQQQIDMLNSQASPEAVRRAIQQGMDIGTKGQGRPLGDWLEEVPRDLARHRDAIARFMEMAKREGVPFGRPAPPLSGLIDALNGSFGSPMGSLHLTSPKSRLINPTNDALSDLRLSSHSRP